MDVDRIRAEFPALAQTVHGRPLVYLDSASTAQKPRAVIEAVRHMLERDCANVHRGVHALSAAATERYEAVRDKVRRFIGAPHESEIVFTRGTTEAINLVAWSLGRRRVGAGDEVVITELEHHANIVPWQMLCRERGARLRVIPVDDRGAIDLDRADEMITERARIVAVSHVSNALGTIVPVRAIARLARARGAVVLVDGAQAVPHLSVDVAALDCDFYCFSSHKLFGPTGAGVLWGRKAILEEMPPWQGGGDMVLTVNFDETRYREIPYRFEAGTPDIIGVVGMGAAIDWLSALDRDEWMAHEADLLAYATDVLSNIDGIQLIGTAPEKTAVLSFSVAGVHPHDVGSVLDHEGVAIRTGLHCAQPVLERLGSKSGTARASLALYNTRAEIDALARALDLVVTTFRP